MRPPRRERSDRSRGRRRSGVPRLRDGSGAERRADPPRSFWRRVRRGGSRRAQRGPRRADLRRAARARERSAAGAGLTGAPLRAADLPHRPPPAGSHSTGPERSAGRKQAACQLRWRAACRLVTGSLAHRHLGAVAHPKPQSPTPFGSSDPVRLVVRLVPFGSSTPFGSFVRLVCAFGSAPSGRATRSRVKT